MVVYKMLLHTSFFNCNNDYDKIDERFLKREFKLKSRIHLHFFVPIYVILIFKRPDDGQFQSYVK